MNPYKILNIDRKADKKGIIQAAASALRERRFSAREVALAQKELLDPASRSVHDFLHFLDVEVPLVRPSSRNASNRPLVFLERLSVFDEDV